MAAKRLFLFTFFNLKLHGLKCFRMFVIYAANLCNNEEIPHSLNVKKKKTTKFKAFKCNLAIQW